MKVEELSGAILDAWVAKALGHSNISIKDDVCHSCDPIREYWCARPFSTDWRYGGEVIDAEVCQLLRLGGDKAMKLTHFDFPDQCWAGHVNMFQAIRGETALQAAMRAVVLSKFGDTVPDGCPA